MRLDLLKVRTNDDVEWIDGIPPWDLEGNLSLVQVFSSSQHFSFLINHLRIAAVVEEDKK